MGWGCRGVGRRGPGGSCTEASQHPGLGSPRVSVQMIGSLCQLFLLPPCLPSTRQELTCVLLVCLRFFPLNAPGAQCLSHESKCFQSHPFKGQALFPDRHASPSVTIPPQKSPLKFCFFTKLAEHLGVCTASPLSA